MCLVLLTKQDTRTDKSNVRFHLYDVQEQGKYIYGVRSQKAMGIVTEWTGMMLLVNCFGLNSRYMNFLFIL